MILEKVFGAEDRHGNRLHYGWRFWCPGCQEKHKYRTLPRQPEEQWGAAWTFNGDPTNPTFSPSLGIGDADYWRIDGPRRFKCHLFVENGMIRYLDDCQHHLAGQTIPMVPKENWGEDRRFLPNPGRMI